MLVAILGILFLISFSFKFKDYLFLNKPQVNLDGILWQSSLDLALRIATEQNKIVLVDLSANWCEPCQRFEQVTFSNSEVQLALKNLITVRLDFNLVNSENEDFSNKYNVLGLPTIIFIDSQGDEITDSRIEGFLNPKEFLLHLKDKVYSKTRM